MTLHPIIRAAFELQTVQSSIERACVRDAPPMTRQACLRLALEATERAAAQIALAIDDEQETHDPDRCTRYVNNGRGTRVSR